MYKLDIQNLCKTGYITNSSNPTHWQDEFSKFKNELIIIPEIIKIIFSSMSLPAASFGIINSMISLGGKFAFKTNIHGKLLVLVI